MAEKNAEEVLQSLQAMRQEDLRALAEKERDLVSMIRVMEGRQNARLQRVEDNLARITTDRDSDVADAKESLKEINEKISAISTKLVQHNLDFATFSAKFSTKTEGADNLLWRIVVPLITGVGVGAALLLAKVVLGVS
jgi:hypothetical protein